MRNTTDRQIVIAMHQAGQSIRGISRQMKMSRKTIRRILAGDAPERINRSSRYDPLAKLVCQLYQQFGGNCVMIQTELADQYAQHIPYTSLTRMVRSLNLRPEKTRRSGTYSYPPGRESQHDTSPHRVSIAGKRRKAQCASMVLANCRLLFFQYYPRFTRFEAKAFLSTALDYFDGATETCIIDNTSVLVVAGSGPDAVIAPEIEAFGAIYGIRFVAHAIGHANRSALVERNFHYIENSFLPGKDFDDWHALNDAARNWCDQVANNTIKRALGMTARQAYQSERPFLQPLPAVTPPIYQALTRTVDLYGYVTVDTNRYSVPERLCGKIVEVQKGLYDVRIFHNHRKVATHARIHPDYVTNKAVFDELHGLQYPAVPVPVVVGRQQDVLFLGDAQHVSALFGCHRHRFLAADMFACRKAGDGEIVMCVVRRNDHDEVHIRLRKHVRQVRVGADARKIRLGSRAAPGVKLSHGDGLCALCLQL